MIRRHQGDSRVEEPDKIPRAVRSQGGASGSGYTELSRGLAETGFYEEVHDGPQETDYSFVK